jgi:hypothetical protein
MKRISFNMKLYKRRLTGAICSALMGISLCGLVTTTDAATYYVPGNYASIGAAIAAVPDGSAIIVSPGTYTETIAALNLNKTLYVRSSGNASNTVLNGNDTYRLLRIDNNEMGDPDKYLVFDGFTFSRGRGDTSISPISLVNTKAEFINCRFMDNSSPAKGGAVLVAATAPYNGTRTHPVFANCEFQNNRSDGFGGAVLVNGGQCQASFKNCLFKNNSNRTPGANYLIEGGAINYAEAGGVIDSCAFIGNSTYYAGGALMLLTWWHTNTSSLVIRNSRFENNFCQEGSTIIEPPTEGGAIMVENNFNVEISGCTFSNNWAEAGGAIHSFRAGLTIRRSVFEANDALGAMSYGNPSGYGGAIGMRLDDTGDPDGDHPEPALEIEDTLFRNCSGPTGGGIYFQGDPGYGHLGVINLNRVTIEECESTGTHAVDGHSGAIHLHVANLTGNQVYLLNNHANRLGGAMTLDQNATMTLNNSFIIGNDADIAIDDIYNPYSMSYTLNNTVLAFNGGSPTYNSSFFVPVPRVTVNNTAYLTYYVSPDSGNPSITPDIGSLPDLGAYRTGSADARPPFNADLRGGTSTYYLSSSYPTQTAAVDYSYKGMTNAPFKGQPVRLPARVEAEDFDRGGEAGGYHDTTANNAGGTYRPSEGVDIVPLGAGCILGWLEPGEWMEYAFNVPLAGVFDLAVSVAAPAAGGSLYVQVDDADKTGLLTVPNTGGWTTFQPVSKTGIFLSAGLHIMRVVIVTGGFNLDYVDWTQSPNDPILSVSTTSISRYVKLGKTGTQTFQVWNSGANSLGFTVTNDVEWLTVSPPDGTSTGEKDTITVQFNAGALATGTYSGVIVVESPDATNSPQQVAVTMNVVPDRNVRCDFDGDGRSDWGVWRPSTMVWYIQRSSLGLLAQQFGGSGDIPVPADYDGDGFTDFAVFRPSLGKWYIVRSSTGELQQFQYGAPTDKPVPADYDGDGLADPAVYRPSSGTWYISGTTSGAVTEVWGNSTDIPAPADYDGDKRDDICVFRPSVAKWYVRGGTWYVFGSSSDLPVPGDYTGDGVLDQGVFRPSTVSWIIRNPVKGFTKQFQFGGYGDQPLR